MVPEFVPEEQIRRVETVDGQPIAIRSYRLGVTYYAQAEIHIDGAGARIASASGLSRATAEGKLLTEVRRLLAKKA